MATNTKTNAPTDTETRAGQDMAAAEAAPVKLEVTVRPIEPRGKLIGFASVNFGGVVVDDFKVFDGEKGLFVGNPSRPDNTTRSGYRSTARVIDKAFPARLNDAARDAYVAEVEKLQARAAAVRSAPEKPRIREQLDKAAQDAAKDNAARPTPEKGKAARDDR